MIIVVDGMGGDFAPGEAVCGAVSAIKEPNIDIIITGKEDIINNELKNTSMIRIELMFWMQKK
jgi:Fatty acid/phospholipid biosynthesis enzyme